ncbi:MAG: hypothetical protein IT180_03410 [Acidobacteria bacterium]|nr:hypothetical protein [Acidobacteriota bacterium]
MALTTMAQAYMTDDHAAKAREALTMARDLEPANYLVRLLRALPLAVEGRREEALAAMDDGVLKYGEFIIAACNVAEFYAVLGNRPRALEWLERAARAGDERAEWLERDPPLAGVATSHASERSSMGSDTDGGRARKQPGKTARRYTGVPEVTRWRGSPRPGSSRRLCRRLPGALALPCLHQIEVVPISVHGRPA